MHHVVRRIVGFHRLERSRADVQQQIHSGHPVGCQRVEQTGCEVKAGRGGGHRSRLSRVHRLVSLPILGTILYWILRPADRDNESPEFVDSNDDGGAGFNALMAFSPAEAGDYIVRVTSFGENGRGSYRLWITP